MCPFAGKTQGDEGGTDFGGRAKSACGDFKDKFGTCVNLCGHGKIAIRFAPGRCSEPVSNLALHDEVHFVDKVREGKEVMQNGRSNVVGKIAVNQDTAGGNGGQVGFENVPLNDGEIGESLGQALETCDELGV